MSLAQPLFITQSDSKMSASSPQKHICILFFSVLSSAFLLIMLSGSNWTEVVFDINRGNEAYSLTGTTTYSKTKAAEQTATFSGYSISDGTLGTNCLGVGQTVMALTAISLILHLLVIGSWIFYKGVHSQKQRFVTAFMILVGWIFVIASVAHFNVNNECLTTAKNSVQALRTDLVAGSGLGVATIILDFALLLLYGYFTKE
jgi:uncharacterized membrane protein YidH (DUF202 family)